MKKSAWIPQCNQAFDFWGPSKRRSRTRLHLQMSQAWIESSCTHGPALRQVSPGAAPGDSDNGVLDLPSSVLATGYTERQFCLAGLGMDRQTACRSQMFMMFAVFMEGFTHGHWNRSRHGDCCESIEKLNWFYEVDGLKGFLNLQKSVWPVFCMRPLEVKLCVK